MAGRAEPYSDEMATPEMETLCELEAEEGILRAGPEAVPRKADEATTVAGDEFRDALREQCESERVVGPEQIIHEVMPALFRIYAEAQQFGAFEKFAVSEGVEFFDPEVAGA
jgi:hypothetical protein